MLSPPVSRPPAMVSPASCGLILMTGRGSSAIHRMWSTFMRAIGLTKCFLVLGVEIGIGGRHVDAAAVGVEFPAVIDAADAALLDAAEPEIGAAVRTVLIDDANHAARVAKREQLLAHHDDLLRRTVDFRQFLGEQYG